jgi:hypothetical protein
VRKLDTDKPARAQSMTNLLLALKLGLYAPSFGLGINPYLSADVISPKSIRPGVEIGVALEPVRREAQWRVNGRLGQRAIYIGTYLTGLTWSIRKDISVATGVKYRPDDDNINGYVGVALRFKAVEWTK